MYSIDLPEEEKGRIVVEHRIICGWCKDWEYLDGGNKRAMIKWAKYHGWVDTEELGWVCPECLKRMVKDTEEDEEENNP